MFLYRLSVISFRVVIFFVSCTLGIFFFAFTNKGKQQPQKRKHTKLSITREANEKNENFRVLRVEKSPDGVREQQRALVTVVSIYRFAWYHEWVRQGTPRRRCATVEQEGTEPFLVYGPFSLNDLNLLESLETSAVCADLCGLVCTHTRLS